MPVFPAPLVLDPVTLTPRKESVGESGTLVYPGTTTPVTPLLAYASGEEIVGAILSVSELYALTPFVTPDGVYEVEFLAADGVRSFLSTDRGAQLAAEEARDQASTAATAASTAASAAATSAAAAAARAIPAGGVIGQALLKTGSADYVAGWGDVAAGPSNGGSGGGNTYTITGASQPRNNPLTGAVLPSPPSAVVIWIAETRPAAMVNGDQWYIPVTTG